MSMEIKDDSALDRIERLRDEYAELRMDSARLRARLRKLDIEMGAKLSELEAAEDVAAMLAPHAPATANVYSVRR